MKISELLRESEENPTGQKRAHWLPGAPSIDDQPVDGDDKIDGEEDSTADSPEIKAFKDAANNIGADLYSINPFLGGSDADKMNSTVAKIIKDLVKKDKKYKVWAPDQSKYDSVSILLLDGRTNEPINLFVDYEVRFRDPSEHDEDQQALLDKIVGVARKKAQAYEQARDGVRGAEGRADRLRDELMDLVAGGTRKFDADKSTRWQDNDPDWLKWREKEAKRRAEQFAKWKADAEAEEEAERQAEIAKNPSGRDRR